MFRLGLFVIFAVVFLAAALCPAQEAKLKEFTFSEVHMGTEFKLLFYANDEALAKKAAKAAFARAAELDHIMSDYKKTSELMQLCQKAGGPPVKVSKDLFQVLSRAQDLAKKSDGAFDVTVGPAIKLWRKARKLRELPDLQKLKEALAKVGYQKMQLDPLMQTVRLLMDMLLDLGGIAKGYAADAMLQVLRTFGIHQALVAASGDIAVGDAPPGKKGWKVAIGDLKYPNVVGKDYLLLKNAAVSTSGDLNQYVEINGVRYSHIIDPRTGLGLIGRSSVTVVAKDCTTTDSMATAVSVLGPEKGMKLIEATKDVAALIMWETKNGQIETQKSKRFSLYEYPKEKLSDTNVSFDMVAIPGGVYLMGSPESEKGRDKDEGPQHPVKVGPFWMGKCEVTWDEYDMYWRKPKNDYVAKTDLDKAALAVTKPTKPYSDETFGHGRKGQPVLCITNHAAMEYCRWLSAKTGKTYRLPTEAEWEWACRAGTTTAYFFGDDASKLGEYAWFDENADEKTQLVGKKKANPWGLHDMSGNIGEWCLDHYQADYYSNLPIDKISISPVVLPTAKRYPHVVRGGSWLQDAKECRSAARYHSTPDFLKRDPQTPQSIWWMTDADFVGFRVVCPVEEQENLKGLKSKVTRESPDN